MTRREHLKKTIISKTNNNGINFLEIWILRDYDLVGILESLNSDWFYVLIKNKKNKRVSSISLPYETGKASFFGSLDYLACTLAEDISYKLKKRYSYNHFHYMNLYKKILTDKILK